MIAKAVDTTASVWPSGVACAATAQASVPPAPERFSMTTGCPHMPSSFGAINRALMSVALPGENPTRKRTDFVGNFSAVCAMADATASHPAANAVATIHFRAFRDCSITAPHDDRLLRDESRCVCPCVKTSNGLLTASSYSSGVGGASARAAR